MTLKIDNFLTLVSRDACSVQYGKQLDTVYVYSVLAVDYTYIVELAYLFSDFS